VNYKVGGRHWVIDSGCKNHITGERKIFSHLDKEIFDFDNITFGDDSKGGVKGIGVDVKDSIFKGFFHESLYSQRPLCVG
jgi:hypothetical protein